ncbi:MAG: hypothetical protein HRU46_02880 [Verrucomicrobiales bacterium]|nr:hypothetical protein [Verrucomicrobiales bacterium]
MAGIPPWSRKRRESRRARFLPSAGRTSSWTRSRKASPCSWRGRT